jgi:hypothetical protein
MYCYCPECCNETRVPALEIVIFIFFGQRLVSGITGSYGSSTCKFFKETA